MEITEDGELFSASSGSTGSQIDPRSKYKNHETLKMFENLNFLQIRIFFQYNIQYIYK